MGWLSAHSHHNHKEAHALFINVVFCTISIAPVADCTEDFTFDRIKYSKNERGYRYLDGFVDCAAASEGNRYYVEDYVLPIPLYNYHIESCFASDGLCLELTSKKVQRGWYYKVYDLDGENCIHNIMFFLKYSLTISMAIINEYMYATLNNTIFEYTCTIIAYVSRTVS